MKFRNYLDTISDIGLYPLISLLVFVAFFIGLLWYVFSMNKKDVKKNSEMPLEDGTKGKALAVLGFVLISFSANAQSAEGATAAGNEELLLTVVGVVIFFVAILLGALLVQVYTLNKRVNQRLNPTQEKESTEFLSDKWWKRFGGFNVELSEEDKILIKEHDYDGIQELDNRMPPWLSFLFQATIVFAVVYMLIYHVFRIGDLPHAELAKDLEAAAIQKAAYLEKAGAQIDESNVTLVSDQALLDQGRTLYNTNCAACHLEDGGGAVGPNLTDNYWLHGGSLQDIFKVIKYGVPEKGMISWESQLKPQEIQYVASYIYSSLVGSTPAVPKEAQGELWEESEVAAEASQE